MAAKRIHTSRLTNVGMVASEHAQVYRKLKAGKLNPSLASRMSAILVNHRVILETKDAETRIQQLEAALEAAISGKPNNVIPLKASPRG
jgi:hypothetical protein